MRTAAVASVISCFVVSGPYFLAFDVLSIDGEDLRGLPLVQRKRRFARIMPRVESRLVLIEPIRGRGCRLYELACEHHLEGIVAKHRKAPYSQDQTRTSWVKIKRADYTQAEGRHELFAARLRGARPHYRKQPLALAV